MTPLSFIRRFEERLHPTPLRERIGHALFKLGTQREKLEHMAVRLQQRDQELFQRCIGAEVAKDMAHAKLYANECAEIRKIAKIVLGSQLALEKVILRLQTIEEFGDVMVQMAPIVGVVRETKGKIAGVVPQVAGELEEVNNMLSDMSMEAGDLNARTFDIETSDEEAKKVLEESTAIAEQKLSERFPQLPRLETPTRPIESEPVLLPATGDPTPIEDQVYEYIRTHQGDLNVPQCAVELGASTNLVKDAVERLRGSGKIVIQ